jgi:DeoR-like helix-turn-helix domain
MSDIDLEILSKKDTALVYDKSFINKVYKRTERVCNGTFYILDKIHTKDSEKENEIIRHIRSLIPDILKDASELLVEDIVSVKRKLASFEQRLVYLVSLITIATTAEYIQASYAGLLSLEIEAIFAELATMRTKNREVKVVKHSTLRRLRADLSGMSDGGGAHGAGQEQVPAFAQVRTEAPQRKDRIRTILEEKGQVSIKDISDIIKDVSEKSIQRDLNDLIEAGTIVRIGERRWSTYKLI